MPHKKDTYLQYDSWNKKAELFDLSWGMCAMVWMFVSLQNSYVEILIQRWWY